MGEGPMVRRIPPIDENDEETFVELTEEEFRELTNVPLPIPEGIELSDDDEEGIEPSDESEASISDSEEMRQAMDNENLAVDIATEAIAPAPSIIVVDQNQIPVIRDLDLD